MRSLRSRWAVLIVIRLFPLFPSKWAFNGVTIDVINSQTLSLREVSLKRWTGSLSKTGVGATIAADEVTTHSRLMEEMRILTPFFLIDKNDLWMSQQKSPKPPRELKRTRCDNVKHWKFSFRESVSPSGGWGLVLFRFSIRRVQSERDAVR